MNKLIFGILGWMVATFAIAGNSQNFDQQYTQWKAKQQVVHQTQSTVPQNNSEKMIHLNQASALELQQKMVGIGEKKAQAIVQYRQQHGKFSNIDELKNIKGIGAKLLEKNRAILRL